MSLKRSNAIAFTRYKRLFFFLDVSNSSRTVVRARRGVAAKSDLPEIEEEKVNENVSIILIMY